MKEYVYERNLTEEDKARARTSMEEANQLLQARYEPADTTLVVWVGDTHLHKSFYTAEEKGLKRYAGLPGHYRHLVSTKRQLELALYEIGLLDPKPDLLILGGDLVEYGFAVEYDLFFEIVERIQDIPVYCISGNHEHGLGDLPAEFSRAYETWKRPYWPPLESSRGFYYAFTHNDIRFVCIDRQVDAYGLTLEERQYQWLKVELDSGDMSTIICSHRPLLPVGNWIDDRFPDIGLCELINQYPQVQAVLSGHNHTHHAWKYWEKLHIVFPSTSYAVGTFTGWGGILIRGGKVEDVFAKELTGPRFNSIHPGKLFDQPGSLHVLEPKNFEESPLFNPELWARG